MTTSRKFVALFVAPTLPTIFAVSVSSSPATTRYKINGYNGVG
ncbi:hypothetical protein [Periweissella cryptocerci]|nr:hypothetical protein [Periweissella cryptocerci]